MICNLDFYIPKLLGVWMGHIMGSRILLLYVIHYCVYLLRWRADSDKYSQWSHAGKNCYSKKYLTGRSPFYLNNKMHQFFKVVVVGQFIWWEHRKQRPSINFYILQSIPISNQERECVESTVRRKVIFKTSGAGNRPHRLNSNICRHNFALETSLFATIIYNACTTGQEQHFRINNVAFRNARVM